MKSKQITSIIIKITLVIFIMHLTLYCICQNKIDSIQQNSINVPSDSLIALNYFEIAKVLLEEQPNNSSQTIETAKKSLKLAQEGHFNELEIDILSFLGSIHITHGKMNEAISFFYQIIELAKLQIKNGGPVEKKQFTKIIFLAKNQIAKIYHLQGKNDEALSIKLENLEYFQKTNDLYWIAKSFQRIARDYQLNHEVDTAINYLYQAKNIFPIDSLNPTLKSTYFMLGRCFQDLNHLDSALNYFILAKSIDEPKSLNPANDTELAIVYSKQKNYQKSNELFEKIIKTVDQDNSNLKLKYYKLSAIESYLDQGLIEKAGKIFEEVKTSTDHEVLIYRQKLGKIGSKMNIALENYKDALYYSDLFHLATDSLDNIERDSRFKIIERKYNIAKKQETINAQKIKLENYGMGLLATMGLVIFTSLFFYYYRKQSLLQNRIIEQEAIARQSEIDNLKKENKIISMQSMLEGQEDERRRIAQDLHDNIGTLMTSLKMKFLSLQKDIADTQNEKIVKEIDTMINNASLEVRRISHQMTPQVLELTGLQGSVQELASQITNQNIELKSTIDALVEIKDKKMALNIYRIVQELYNNIIKHAQATKVSLFTEIRDHQLIIRIRDNGIGISTDALEQKNSLGLSGIKDRVEYLNGTLTLIEDTGTHFKITIPLS